VDGSFSRDSPTRSGTYIQSNSNNGPRRMKVSPLSFPIGVLAWRLSIAEIHGRRDYWVYKLISCFKVPCKVADFFYRRKIFSSVQSESRQVSFLSELSFDVAVPRLQISEAGAMSVLKFPSRNLLRQFLQVVKSFIAVSLPLLEFLVNSKLNYRKACSNSRTTREGHA